MPSRSNKQRLVELLREKQYRESHRAIERYFKDAGEFRRDLYPKQLTFFGYGSRYRERALIAANRTGKTLCGGYELALHLTGRYPAWWQGKRFAVPTSCWAASDSRQTTRDIQQLVLLGDTADFGSGMIPAECIVGKPRTMQGVPNAVESVQVRHVCGGVSTLGFKSFDQGRKYFQGTAKHAVWLDEECPEDIYEECLIRTMTTHGLVYVTFTAVNGWTPLVLSFLPGAKLSFDPTGSRATVTMGWDDVPHLSAGDKAELRQSIKPWQFDARTKGLPGLKTGAVWPIPESEITVSPFALPLSWPRCYALDVGWNRTAALWGAHDRESDTLYLYSEHYRGKAEPSVHARAVRARGAWIPGVIDPAARGRSQVDGRSLLALYSELGLQLEPADNGVETGIDAVYDMLSSGRLKVFNTLENFFSEYRLYGRDKTGKVNKHDDHLMDCMRYLVMSGRVREIVKPAPTRRRAVMRIADVGAGY